MLVLEAYTPKQLEYKTGGPLVAELIMTLSELRKELADLELVHALETERSVIQGRLRYGHDVAVQILAIKSLEQNHEIYPRSLQTDFLGF